MYIYMYIYYIYVYIYMYIYIYIYIYVYCKLMAFTQWFKLNKFIYLHKIFIDIIIYFYYFFCNDTFYVGIYLCFIFVYILF